MSTDTPLEAASILPNANITDEDREWNAEFSDDNLHNTTTTTNTLLDITNSSDATPNICSALAIESIDINGTKDKDNSEANSKSNTTSGGGDNKEDDKNEESMFECNICLDPAKDAVVSMCGHLFCWPCLHQWLETRPNRKLCPVCKAAISKYKVIPLYGRNSTKQEDPRNKVPPRPAGQRIEPEPQPGFEGFSFGDNFPAPDNRGTALNEDEQEFSNLFLYLAYLCILWLLFG